MKSILVTILFLGPFFANAESDKQNFHQKVKLACSSDFARAPAAVDGKDRRQWLEANEDSFSQGCKDVLDEIHQQRTLEHLLLFSQPHWQK